MAIAAFAVALIAIALGTADVSSDAVANCNQEDDRQVQISGCSQLIGLGDTGDPVPYINRGIALASTRQYVRALEDFNVAIRINPHEALAYYNRGNVHYDLSHYGKAVADYGRAIKLDPENALFYYNRALAYDRSGKPKNAIQDLKRAIEINPEFAVAEAHLARLIRKRR
jgi:tetratricopeptide (TPR) repeat protein